VGYGSMLQENYVCSILLNSTTYRSYRNVIFASGFVVEKKKNTLIIANSAIKLFSVQMCM